MGTNYSIQSSNSGIDAYHSLRLRKTPDGVTAQEGGVARPFQYVNAAEEVPDVKRRNSAAEIRRVSSQAQHRAYMEALDNDINRVRSIK